MSTHQGTPLSAVDGWSEAHANKLAQHWITTAEQVVGMGATAEGVRTLAEQLGVPSTEMQRLLERARQALPPAVAAELGNEVDTSQYGLGALPPKAPPGPRAGAGDKKPRKRG